MPCSKISFMRGKKIARTRRAILKLLRISLESYNTFCFRPFISLGDGEFYLLAFA